MKHLNKEEESEIIEMCESSSKREESDESELAENDVMIKPEKCAFTINSPVEENTEGFWLITIQVFFPFLIAGLGMVGAGLVLDIVQVS